MSSSPYLSSSTRISDLASGRFEVEARPRESWDTGDYVVVECSDRAGHGVLELPDGRLLPLEVGDRFVGVLGHRKATREAAGSWEVWTPNGMMDLLTAGGLLGRCTSRSSWIPPLLSARYLGHACRYGVPLRMRDFVVDPGGEPDLGHPCVLISGTSMSCGKTGAARAVIRRLRRMGLRVVAAKLTGAARYRDIQSMADAGAHAVFDFVDGGLPSTVCSNDQMDRALRIVLAKVAATPADVVVVELGASPLEPYQGLRAIPFILPRVRLSILSASDAYAVVGFLERVDLPVDLVTGTVANTTAGEELVRHLTGVHTLDSGNPARMPELDALLRRHLGVTASS